MGSWAKNRRARFWVLSSNLTGSKGLIGFTFKISSFPALPASGVEEREKTQSRLWRENNSLIVPMGVPH
jgi:hypothetical protein